jgi:hypothetical protein
VASVLVIGDEPLYFVAARKLLAAQGISRTRNYVGVTKEKML